MQSTQIRNRLGKVESALKQRKNVTPDSRFEIRELVERAVMTMRYQDRDEFVEMLEMWLQIHLHRTLAKETPLSPVKKVFEEIIEATFHKPIRPVYFGPEVFGLYKNGKSSSCECGDCGCLYPADALETCPLCGGHIGRHALNGKTPKPIPEHVYKEVQLRLLGGGLE